MKKEVQALIHRRRARFVPAILAGLAGLILLAFVFLVVNYFTSGPGQALFQTATPSPTNTYTPAPHTPTPAASPTPQFSPTPTDTPGPSPTPMPITYTVQEGDSLFGIAVQFQVDMEAIKIANGLVSDALSVGQVLIIPTGDIQTPTPTPLPTGLPRGARIQYVVLLGDTLELIASKFNSTVADISQVNSGLTNETLQAGQVIVVRINLVTPTPTPTITDTPGPGTPSVTPTATVAP
jgi:LysM repeat protein